MWQGDTFVTIDFHYFHVGHFENLFNIKIIPKV